MHLYSRNNLINNILIIQISRIFSVVTYVETFIWLSIFRRRHLGQLLITKIYIEKDLASLFDVSQHYAFSLIFLSHDMMNQIKIFNSHLNKKAVFVVDFE